MKVISLEKNSVIRLYWDKNFATDRFFSLFVDVLSPISYRFSKDFLSRIYFRSSLVHHIFMNSSKKILLLEQTKLKNDSLYSSFTLTWIIVNDFQVEFFSFNHRKTMEIECL